MDSQHTYCIAYINRKLLTKLQHDLMRCDLQIEVVIPTVNVLTKKFKGKEHFDEVPLMLNYGFVKVNDIDLYNLEFFRDIAAKINCISGFLKEKSEDGTVSIATTTKKAVNQVLKAGKRMSIYTGMDFNTLKGRDEIRRKYEPHRNDNGEFIDGKVITLKGYPFDGVEAQIIKIKFAKCEVEVLLQLGLDENTIAQPATISFHNMFYTIYDEADEEQESMRERSIEDMTYTHKNPELVLDKLMHKAYETSTEY